MANNHCPECRNLVAYSAKKCPQCGNRDFITETDDFADVCKTCEGGGKRYHHVGHVIHEDNCEKCDGQGYLYHCYTHDCRDFDEWDRLWNLARKKSKEDKKIIDAIVRQEYNSVFVDRGGRLKHELKRAADFRYRANEIFESGRRLDINKSNAWKAFERRYGVIFAAWLIVGLIGCVLRVAAISSSRDATALNLLSSFFAEGILAGVSVLIVSSIILRLQIRKARSEHDMTMSVVKFDNMETIDYG